MILPHKEGEQVNYANSRLFKVTQIQRRKFLDGTKLPVSSIQTSNDDACNDKKLKLT